MDLARGFAHYEGILVTPVQILCSAALPRWLYASLATRFPARFPPVYKFVARKTATEINDAALAWIDQAGDRPFLAFLNYFDAHDPYRPIAPFDTMFASPAYPDRPPPIHAGADREGAPRAMRPYDQAIRYIDAEVGRLLAALSTRNRLKETLVIITADHGEEFGEHVAYGHGHSLYLQGLQVGLVLVLPEHIPAGTIVRAPVSLRDVAPTVLDLVDRTASSPFPGRSLARFWLGDSLTSDTLLFETRRARNRPSGDPTATGDLQGALAGGLHFMRGADRRPQLYDIDTDPHELHDLASAPGNRAAVLQFQDLLDRANRGGSHASP